MSPRNLRLALSILPVLLLPVSVARAGSFGIQFSYRQEPTRCTPVRTVRHSYHRWVPTKWYHPCAPVLRCEYGPRWHKLTARVTRPSPWRHYYLPVKHARHYRILPPVHRTHGRHHYRHYYHRPHQRRSYVGGTHLRGRGHARGARFHYPP